MKKFLFLLSFLTLGALTTMNAQTTGKTCAKKDAKCCAKKLSTAAGETSTATTVAAASATADTKTKACAKAKGGKACCAKKGAKTTSVAGVSMDASKAAKADEMIEERTCAKSGATSFYKKEFCPKSGKASFTQVNYDDATAKFVNMAPSEGSAKKDCAKKCTKAEAASCKKKVKSAKVVKTSVKE